MKYLRCRSIRGSAVGYVAVAATVLALSGVCEAQSTGPPDPPCDVAEPVVLYNADCDLEPQDANPAWCDNECGPFVPSPPDDFGTIIGNKGDRFLRIGDDSTELRAYYCRTDVFDPACDGTQQAVFEIAGRGIVADTTPPHQIDFYLGVGLRDGNPANPLLNGKDITILIATTGVGFHENTGNGQDWIPGGAFTPQGWNGEAYHIYRVEKHVIDDNLTEVRLFVDNPELPQVTLNYNLLPDITQNRALMSTSTPGTSTFDVDFYRYRIGTTTLRTGPNCAADIDNNGTVGASDLLILLASWGPCADCNDCAADIDDTCDSDCVVGSADLLFLLNSWGDC